MASAPSEYGPSVSAAPASVTPAAPAAAASVRLVPVKIVIAGGFGVGKTTLVGAVSEITPLSTEEPLTGLSLALDDRAAMTGKRSTTVALDFGRITMDGGIVLYLFGTPGQDRFGFMWDDLMTGALGAIVLVDRRRIEASFPALDYCERKGMPFVIAVNRFHGKMHHEAIDVREALTISTDVPLLAIDARERDGAKEALLALLDLVLQRALAKMG